MARLPGTRVPDDEVKAAVTAGFRDAVGYDPSDDEIESLRPLWSVAGYDPDDTLWCIVFVFARQFVAAERHRAQLEKLEVETTNTIETSLKRMADAVRRAASRGELVRMATMLAVGNVVAIALVAAFATWWVYPQGERAGRSAAIEMARAHSPTLLSEVYDYPALTTEDLQWCDSARGRKARAVCNQKEAFLDSPLARASFLAYESGLGANDKLINLILCLEPPLERELFSAAGSTRGAGCRLTLDTWRWAVPFWVSDDAQEMYERLEKPQLPWALPPE